MASTQQWLESYRSGRYVFALVFEGIDLVCHTGDATDQTSLASLFTAAGAPYSEFTTFSKGLKIAGTLSQEIELYSQAVKPDELSFTIVDDRYTDSVTTKALTEAKTSGKRTYLTSSMPAGSTAAINVKDTTGFAASGTIYIGHEAIGYTAKTATTFTGITRGKWALLQTNGGSSFGPAHTIGNNVTVNATTAPAVTDFPRTWYGRPVHLLMFHVDTLTKSLCSVSDARVLWRGRIQSHRDNGDGSLSISCKSIVDILHQMVGAETWEAKLSPNLYVGATDGVYNSRLVVVNGQSVAYALSTRLTGGFLTHSEIAEQINAQFESWRASMHAGDSWSINLVDTLDGASQRYQITFRANTTTIGENTAIWMAMHPDVASTLGFAFKDPKGFKTSGDSVIIIALHRITSGLYTCYANEPPVVFFSTQLFQGATIRLDNEVGTWVSQAPLGHGAPGPCDGVIQIQGGEQDGIYCVNYTIATGSSPSKFQVFGRLNLSLGTFEPITTSVGDVLRPIRLGEIADAPTVRQVIFDRGPAGQVLLRALLSTAGNPSNYNHATFDVWTQSGFGAAVPANIIDLDSWQDLDEVETMILVTQPQPFHELLEPVLAITNRYVVWRSSTSTAQPKIAVVRPELDQTYQSTWQLTESNKASAGGGNADRTLVERVPDGLINRLVVKYGQGLDKNAKGIDVEINDIASQSDHGKKRSVTIKCPMVPRGSVEKMLGEVAAPIMAYLSRPLAIAERSFNASLLRMAPGDAVSITDNYVMGPRSGTRGSDIIYGWVIGTQFDFTTGVGRVRVVFLPEKAPNYVGGLGPSAKVDENAAGAGYNAGTKTLTFKNNYYSSTSDTSTDVQRFSAGDKVHICELDTAAPLEWTDTIASIPTSTTAVLTTGLAGFDTTKQYVMEYDDINTVLSSQRNASFLADATTLSTGLVGNTVPYEWGMKDPGRGFTFGSVTYSRGMMGYSATSDDQGEPMSAHKLQHIAWGLNAFLGAKSSNVVLNQCVTPNSASAGEVVTGTTETIIFCQWVPLYGGFSIGTLNFNFRGLTCTIRSKVSAGTGTVKIYTSSTPPVGTLTSWSLPTAGQSSSSCTFTFTNASYAWQADTNITSPAVGVHQGGIWGTWVTITAKNSGGGNTTAVGNVAIVERALT